MPAANPSIAQLQRALQITEKIETLEAELRAVLGRHEILSRKDIAVGGATGSEPKESKQGKRTMSASARARISAAQKLRWAKSKGEETEVVIEAKPAAKAGKPRKKKRTMSPEARARIVAAQKARWAKFRKAKK